MAIGTNALIEFFGTQDSVGGSGASVANNAFSVAGDVSTWTNDDDAAEADVILEATFSVAPSANGFVNLYARMDNIQGTSDMDAPSANYPHVYLGAFPVKNITSAQFVPLRISLPNGKTSSEFHFFIENKAGQTISANWDLHITPISKGPHA